MQPTRRDLLRTLGASGVAVGAVGTATGQTDTAEVRAVHASPDAPNVDVFVDGSRLLRDVAYESVTSYLQFTPGTYDVAVAPAGERTPAASTELSVDAGASYTVAATNRRDALELVTFEDVNEQPTLTSRFRAVHLSPDAPALDVDEEDVFVDDFIARDLTYQSAGDYCDLFAGDLLWEVEPADAFDDDLDTGTTYTLWVVGLVDPGEGDPGVDVVVSRDA